MHAHPKSKIDRNINYTDHQAEKSRLIRNLTTTHLEGMYP